MTGSILSVLDWGLIIGALLLFMGVGIISRSKGSDFKSKFLGGGKLPWWVAGTSMVATTFAADTPLAVSELVNQGGIAQNWLWWSFVFGGVLTAVIFAPLWKRSGVGTELEFITFRYGGKAALGLRQFKSVYLGLFMNVFILGWVNLAMHSIVSLVFNCSPEQGYYIVFGLFILSAIYTHIGGLRGVAYADVIQFILAMGGCVILAVLVVNSEDIGGLTGLKSRLPDSYFEFFPSMGEENGMGVLQLTYGAFIAFFAVQWWASWYPGAEPGGGGYVAQRFLGTDSPKEAKKATLLFQIGHYCIRPWPWILVGLCAIALYSPEFSGVVDPGTNVLAQEFLAAGGNISELANQAFISGLENKDAVVQAITYNHSPRLGFVYVMVDFLPAGLMGLLIVAFLAAYMSTIGTQLNWGASYLFNDLVAIQHPKLAEEKPGRVSFGIQVVLIAIGMLVTLCIDSISGVWSFVLECGSGLGLVLILRWFWKRINVYSEISATVAPLIFYTLIWLFKMYWPFSEELLAWCETQKIFFFINVILTSITWVSVTLLTKPESADVLRRFAVAVNPPFGNWGKEGGKLVDKPGDLLLSWLFGIVLVLSLLFCIGGLLFDFNFGLIFGGIALVSAVLLAKYLK